MKKKLLMLMAALLAVGAITTPTANAIDVSISVGDRPYYHGRPVFWDYGWRYVWVPGHWHKRRWIHGYYMRQGEWNRRYYHKRYNWRRYRY
jgi:hypothetical protein